MYNYENKIVKYVSKKNMGPLLNMFFLSILYFKKSTADVKASSTPKNDATRYVLSNPTNPFLPVASTQTTLQSKTVANINLVYLQQILHPFLKEQV